MSNEYKDWLRDHETEEQQKLKKEKIVEQPCCGCIYFLDCGSVTKSYPFQCDKRITCEENGGMLDRGDRIKGTNINSDNDFLCRPTRDWMD